MTTYRNRSTSSPLGSVELLPQPQGNMAFFTARSAEDAEALKNLIASPPLNQKIQAQTELNGHAVFITSGEKSGSELLAQLSPGNHLVEQKVHKPAIDPWKIRGALGFIGQGMVLTSSMLGEKKDPGIALFATANILANSIALIYGSSKTEDEFRLGHVKRQINRSLSKHAPDADLPPVDDDRVSLRTQKDKDTALEAANNVIKENAARISIALRLFGTANMIKSGLTNTALYDKTIKPLLSEGKFKQAWKALPSGNKLVLSAGLGTGTGKLMGLAALGEDPYNPEPKSVLTRMREHMFVPASLLEAGFYGTLSYQGYVNRKIKIKGVPHRDFLRGTGSLLFVAAYITRSFGKPAVKVTDMEEVYAHLTDGLASMPRDKLPQLAANTAAMLTEHFKDQHLNYGEVYSRIVTDLNRYKDIALDQPGTPPAQVEPKQSMDNTASMALAKPLQQSWKNHVTSISSSQEHALSRS